ncbi:hypothetical protein [Amycolatopsis ultiminotia]|uniref:hypothetical protein n=1 Tax=Amycolatopsis ultiminotia TaxID=543629 RepID=UPI0031ED7070
MDVPATSHLAWAVLACRGAATVLLGLTSTGRWAKARAECGGRRRSMPVLDVAR